MVKKSLKQKKKLSDKKCFFCGIDDYDLLDAHRIIEGIPYAWESILVLCSLCHRKVHSGKIKIIGFHPSTSAMWYINYIDEEGVEQWVKK